MRERVKEKVLLPRIYMIFGSQSIMYIPSNGKIKEMINIFKIITYLQSHELQP